AVLATVDGVSVAVSAGLPPERAEQLATIGAGLLSIADGAGVMMNTGSPRHVIVEMYGGLMLAAPVAPHVVLSLLAAHDRARERRGSALPSFAAPRPPVWGHIRGPVRATPPVGAPRGPQRPIRQAGAGERVRRSDRTCSTKAIRMFFVDSRERA